MRIKLGKVKRNKLFTNLLFTVTVTIVLSILVLSMVYYFNFQNIALYMIYSNQKESLSQLSSSAGFMSDSANSLARQILFDPVTNQLFNTNPGIEDEISGVKQIRFFSSTMRYVTSIYVYNGVNNMIYSDVSETGSTDAESFFDQDIIKRLKDFKKIKKSSPIARKVPVILINPSDVQTSNVYTFISYGIQGNNTNLDRAVVINVSLDWMKNIIKDMDPKLQNDIFIVGQDGKIVLGGDKQELLTDVSGEEYFKRIAASGNQSGYFRTKLNGEENLLVYVEIPRLNWIFIRLIPVKEIVSQIEAVRNTTITIGFIILIAGLFVSYFVSRIIFKPTGNILNDLSMLRVENRMNTSALKQKILKDLLLGQLEYSSEKLDDIKKYNKIEFDFCSAFIIILLRIDRYPDYCRKHCPEDRALLKFGMLNIASEIFSSLNKNESVDMNDDKMVLLVNAADYQGNSDYAMEIIKLSKEVQSAISKYINVTVSVTVSLVGEDASDIALLYNKVSYASSYRMFHGYESIIFAGDIESVNGVEYNLERKVEKRLTNLMLSGSFDSVRELYRKIILDASECSYKSFNFTIIRLGMLISEASVIISENYETTLNHDFRNLIFELNEMEVIQDVVASFDGFMDELDEMIDRKKNIKYDEIIDVVQKHINNNYFDKNLSINSLSEMISMSSGYLGRLFKRYTSVALADYINNVRIQKAKELLTSTDLSVNEICDRVGFTNSNYFYPLFKKICGITPKEYRQTINLKLESGVADDTEE